MFVFGYGSLMTDGWENRFDGTRLEGASLPGYQRSFNKASTVNWGTLENPCPTLGLEINDDAECTGCAFEFDDSVTESVLSYLEQREGPSFQFVNVAIQLPDHREVDAITPVNDLNAHTYLGRRSIHQRQRMVKAASGTSGNCEEYVRSVHLMLLKMGVRDENVEEFVAELSE